ncbi:replication endonuclease [Moritella yayanosii]|uniref:Putative phage protein n=1 Tax=Moritella yayanosii TaxID=69539 RepID=A0A330LTZ2_9GAMM|nr:replication endonuclease [Moritella yayanosii]SQD80427.1 putative phage protein [Moritella yayanosii]
MASVNKAQSLSGRKTIIEMIESGEDCSRKPTRTPAPDKEFQLPEMSLIENAMFQVNPEIDDHEWRKQFFGDMPHYLSRYFAERYNKTFERKGRQSANTYLRETVGNKINPRLRKVLARYQDQFKFRQSYVHVNDLLREKLLAEMDKSEIKILGQQFADFFSSQLENLIYLEAAHETDYGKVIIAVFRLLQKESRKLGYLPPYNKTKKLTQAKAESGILRLVCQRAWERKLSSKRAEMREHLALAVGQVQKAASPYCSRDCLREWKDQKKRNRDFIKGRSIFDEDSGEEIALADMFYKSTANPAIRRCEMMVRIAGYQNIAEMLDCAGLFITLTAPSKYHNARKRGGFIGHWLGNNPKETQIYLNKVFARIRAQLKRDGIEEFGMRVVEPHHDGTPHWHLMLFMQPCHVARVREVFTRYAIEDEMEELYPRNKKTGKVVPGPFNPKPRCDSVDMDPSLGTATGYMAKYISKNIDGYAMDGEKDEETGFDQKEMAARVVAWAGRWRIRQFQPLGGAPVTTYRELRRYANNDRNTFNSYVAILNVKEKRELFNDMFPDQNPDFMGPQLDFVGPRLNYDAMSFIQVWDVITGKYKPKLKTGKAAFAANVKTHDDEKLRYLANQMFPEQNPDFIGPQLNWAGPRLVFADMDIAQRQEILIGKYQKDESDVMTTAATALQCADKGDFAGYVMAQGGPFVKRKDLLIRNDYDVTEMGNEYAEHVSKIKGFQITNELPVKTRLRNWVIQRKSQALLDSEASTSSTEGAEVLDGPTGAPWSSVNNCTPSKSDRLNTGIKALLKRRGIHLDDHLVNVMGQGAQIRVDKDHIVKLRQGYYADSQYHPPEVIDVAPEEPNIWDGWNSPETEIKDTSNYTPGWETWESWDWG